MSQNPFINSTSGLSANAGVVGEPGAITATSSTPQTIGTGTLSFQVPTLAAWAPGMFVTIVPPGSPTTYMIGVVQSYSQTTLVVNAISSQGAGTFSSWLINLGAGGATGPAGATGATGATGAAAGPVGASLQGLKTKNNSGTPNTKIDISAVSAGMVNGSGTSVYATGVAVTIDLTTGTSTAAANGMDGEARGTSAWLYLYLISNGSVTAGLATLTSPLSGLPTLPAGYTSYAYVGAMYVDSSGNLLRTLQEKNRSHYVVTAGSNTAALPTMGSGSAGDPTVPTWIAITLAGFVPATASNVLVSANGDVGGTPATVIAAPNNAYGTAISTNPPPVAALTGKVTSISSIPIESASIYWASSGADGYLFCVGWDDYVVAA